MCTINRISNSLAKNEAVLHEILATGGVSNLTGYGKLIVGELTYAGIITKTCLYCF
jgi:hypothetical protein